MDATEKEVVKRLRERRARPMRAMPAHLAKLTRRQLLFLEAYIRTGVGRRAAIEAGYAVNNNNGSVEYYLLRSKRMQEALRAEGCALDSTGKAIHLSGVKRREILDGIAESWKDDVPGARASAVRAIELDAKLTGCLAPGGAEQVGGVTIAAPDSGLLAILVKRLGAAVESDGDVGGGGGG